MTSYEFFGRCDTDVLEEFGEKFSSCSNAFRLELLSEYTEESETPFFVAFLRGEERCPVDFNQEWIEILRDAKRRGAIFERVRLIPNQPPSDYIRFESEWGYRRNMTEGERILQIEVNSLWNLSKIIPATIDFWLFDDSDCYLMLYDYDGRFLGVAKSSAEDLEMFVSAKRFLLSHAVPLKWTSP